MSGSEGAWSSFWAAGGAGPESGRLPNALKAIDAAQRQVWEETAFVLHKGAGVLDLASGDGAVLGKMQRARPDLKLIGIDSSSTLPKAPKGISLRSSISMEALPFADAGFDQVTSQFGFEYGDTAAVAREISRVLRPKGRVRMIVHHRSGPILAHNIPRREALKWASSRDNYLGKARALALARAQARLPTPDLFRHAPGEAQRRFPTEPVAAEFLAAIRETLERSRDRPYAEALEVLGALEDKAANEIARIDSLAAAARDRSGIDLLVAQLRSTGLKIQPAAELFEQKGVAPFGWLVSGQKALSRPHFASKR